MNISHVLTGLFLTISLFVFAQNPKEDSLARHYSKYPRQALQDAEKMYQKATKTHDTPLLVKSLILKTTFTIRTDDTQYPQCIRELEDYAGKEKHPALKSILHSYIGQLYSNYYQNHRWQIDQRSQLQETIPEQMEAWSSNLFTEHILRHLLASVADKQQLQQTPVSDYQTILTEKTPADSLRPTLYDFLCHRAINLLSHLRQEPTVFPCKAPELLANADLFLKMPITPHGQDATSHIFNLWQELLAFHQKQGRTQAFLKADLERLDYARTVSTHPSADSLYLHTLKSMEEEYLPIPMVIEIMAAKANALLQNCSLPPRKAGEEKTAKEQALAICEKGLRLHPRYERINLLNNILQNIKAPSLYCEFAQTLCPGDTLSIKIRSTNLAEATVSIYRLGLSSTAYERLSLKKRAVLPRKTIFRKTYPLPCDLIPQDSLLKIPGLPSGLYAIEIQAPGAKEKVKEMLVCTRLFATAQYLDGKANILVSDWQSGEPVPGATVLLVSQSQGHNRTDTLHTDARGRIRQTVGQNSYLSYEALNAENPAGNKGSLYPHPSSESRERLYIVTDRAIYRPGQTVQFKGFIWRESPDETHALDRKNLELSLRDANRKEIGRQQVSSNRFGTFSGSFALPAQTLNGSFTISNRLYTAEISVADYKRPEFEISFAETACTYYQGDTVRLKGKAKSYAGPALSHTTVKYSISRNIFSSYWPRPSEIIQGIALTDDKGEFEISFTAESSLYSVKASASDAKGETQEAVKLVTILSDKEDRLQLELPHYINKNRKTAFHIARLDFPGQGKIETVTYTLSKLVSPTKADQPSDSTVEKTILSGSLQMGARDSLFPELQKQASGAYLFTVRCGKTKADRIFFLYSTEDQHPPIPTYDWLTEEKTTCHPGDTARIRFGTSATNALVTCSVYTRRKLIRENTVRLSDEIIDINLPYKEEYGPCIWFNIRYVKDKKYINRTVPVTFLQPSKKLHLRTAVFRDKLQPGSREQWEIEVLADNNKAVEAELLALMYDASLDRLLPNPIMLHPQYLYRGFPYPWEHPYATKSTNYGSLSPWSFKRQNRTVPPFRFHELYLYNSDLPQVSECLAIIEDDCLAEPAVTSVKSFGQANAKERTMENAKERTMENNGEGTSVPVVSLRKDFQETAFFYPHLRTDSSGRAIVRFTVPESLTRWKFVALVTTPDMATGQIERNATTSKPLMVRPNLPRFFRSGDTVTLKATVDNLSDSICKGTSTLEFFNPSDGRILSARTQAFDIPAGQSQTLSFSIDAPQDIDLTGVRITAASGLFSDGEQHLVAVLPNETLLTETLPLFADSAGTYRYTLKKSSPGKKNYRLTLETASNPIWYAITALPALAVPRQENATEIGAAYYVNTLAARIAQDNPQITATIRRWSTRRNATQLSSKLEQDKELKSILLEASPWVLEAKEESENIRSLEKLLENNRLYYLQRQAIEKLAALQTEEGGWSWFKGMPASRFITLNMLELMHRADSFSADTSGEKKKRMQQKALHYLDNTLLQTYRNFPKRISHDGILYLYVRSLYKDIPPGKASERHGQLLALAQKQWPDFSLYEKALTAITLKNRGFTDKAREILESLRQYAVCTPEIGMFWPMNKNKGFLENSAIRVHTMLMEAFRRIEGESADLNRMKQWLLAQKRIQSWGSIPATTDAIHLLVSSGNNWTAQREQMKIKLGRHQFSTDTAGSPSGYFKTSFPAEQIKPSMLTVELTKHRDTPSWGGLYLQYFENLDQVKEQKTELSVKKELFLAHSGKNGRTELHPLQQQPLKIGDKVIVRLTLSLKQDMEFLHLKDLRAACFEPAEQLSGNHWAFGTVYYQETENAVTNFFFNTLPRGIHVIEYPLWVSHSGSYQDGISTLQSVYAPEYSAHSASCRILIPE